MDDVKKILGEDLFTSVTAKLGDKQLFLHEKDQKVILDDGSLIKKEGMIPKERFDEVNNKKNEFETKVSDLMKQIDDLKKSSGNKEELEGKIRKLESDYTSLKTESAKETENTKKKFALRDALRENGAKYVDMLETKFDLDKVILGEDGKVKSIKNSDTDIVGFSDHLKTTKETYPDMFGENKRKGFEPGNGKDPHGDFYTEAEVKAMGQEEVTANIDKINKSMESWNKN